MPESTKTTPDQTGIAPTVQPQQLQRSVRDFDIDTNPLGLELRVLVANANQLTDLIRKVAEVVAGKRNVSLCGFHSATRKVVNSARIR